MNIDENEILVDAAVELVFQRVTQRIARQIKRGGECGVTVDGRVWHRLCVGASDVERVAALAEAKFTARCAQQVEKLCTDLAVMVQS